MIINAPPPDYTNHESYLLQLEGEITLILQQNFGLTYNDAEKRVKLFFSPGFISKYYFYSNLPVDIANHIIVITQLLDANKESIAIETKDGFYISYFYNVGSNVPGKLLSLIRENCEIELTGLDTIKSNSGYRLVVLQKKNAPAMVLDEKKSKEAERLRSAVINTGKKCAKQFLASLPPNYLHEEIYTRKKGSRLFRHLEMYEKALENSNVNVFLQDLPEADEEYLEFKELSRMHVYCRNPGPRFLENLLTILRNSELNLGRTYFDLFVPPDDDPENTVAIVSIYLNDHIETGLIKKELNDFHNRFVIKSQIDPAVELERFMSKLLRRISAECDVVEGKIDAIQILKEMVNHHANSTKEIDNFLLNSMIEFLEVSKITGIYENDEILRLLLQFENITEFFVETGADGKRMNKNAYRIRHSSIRGPAKGGLRIHPVAELSEVAALSFMMTWKCSKSRIRLGGGKGGIHMDPNDFSQIGDYNDSIMNFGRSLFIDTGPFLDVPAGDVNCGAKEIGMIFEGYKSALRDLVSLVYASKFGVAYIGKRVVTVEEARRILSANFDIETCDNRIIHWLMTSEEYLQLVVASQITGKPEMGIAARNGATGLGVFYALLAAVGQLFLQGRWDADSEPDYHEIEKIKQVSNLSGSILETDSPQPLVSENDWESLLREIYPKLLRKKKVVLQGTGKVGLSLLKHLREMGVNLVGAADVRGAIIGEEIDIGEVFDKITEVGTIIDVKNGVHSRIAGAKEGAKVLTEICDIVLPCALENAITNENVQNIRTNLIVCGANGPISPMAAKYLKNKNITVVYDFLANSGGVIASYFEWLRGIAERRRFESEVIRRETFDIRSIDNLIMPEFRNRIHGILDRQENQDTTVQWQRIIRDLIFAAFNDDWIQSREHDISLKQAGTMDAQLRVLASLFIQIKGDHAAVLWHELPEISKNFIRPYFNHPEITENRRAKQLEQLLKIDIPILTDSTM